MRSVRTQSSRPTAALLALLAALACSTALAATKTGTPDAKLRYQRDVAACAAIRSDDEHQNCLSEASTRLAATQPSRADESADILLRNALRRCEPLAGPDRADCVARIQGQGTTSGSVSSGGIYRELVTREVGVAPQAAPPAPATPPAVIQ
jgi:hypothetical protein